MRNIFNFNSLKNLIFLSLLSISILYLGKFLVILKFVKFSYIILFLITSFFFFYFFNIKKIFNFLFIILKKINSFPGKNLSFLTLFVAALFLLISITLNYFDNSLIFYDKKFYLIIYIFLKFVFTICLIIFLLNVGFFFNFFINKKINYSTKIIIYFIIGSIITSLFSTFLGLVGLLNYKLILTIFLIVILFSKKLIDQIFNCSINLKFSFVFNIYVSILLLALLILFIRSNFPYAEDGDVWTHYLNFYRSVQGTGQILNPDYWSHFTQLKGHGLNFIAVILSDLFSSSQVSFVYLLFLFLIIFNIGSDFTDNNFVIGFVILLICSYGISLDNDINKISFVKSHIIFSCLYMFIFWSIYKFYFFKEKFKFFYILFLAILFFTGFSHHIFSFIIFCNLIFLLIFFSIFSIKDFKFFFVGTIFLCSGVLISLLINYLNTGMAESVFVKIWWLVADQKKFLDIIGYKNLIWPLVGSDQVAVQTKNFQSFSEFLFNINNIIFSTVLSIFRSYFSFFLYLLLFIIHFKKDKFITNLNIFIFLSFFIILLFFYFFNSPSLTRGYFFISSFFILFFVLNISSFINLCSLRFVNIFQIVFIIPVLFFFSFFIHKNFKKNLEYYKSIYNGNSFKDLLLKCDPTNNVDCQLINFINKIQNKYQYKYLYGIGYMNSQAVTIPYPGIIVEPYFNKSKKINNFLYENNEDLFNEFKLLKINYFIFNSKLPLFGNFLNYEFARDYLKVIEQDKNGFFFLKLEKKSGLTSEDFFFQNIYNLRSSYLVNFIFSDYFFQKVKNLNKEDIKKKITSMSICLNSVNKELLLSSLHDIGLNNNLLSNEFLKKFKVVFRNNIQKFYNLETPPTSHFYLSKIGSLLVSPSNLDIYFINKNKKKECQFYKDVKK